MWWLKLSIAVFVDLVDCFIFRFLLIPFVGEFLGFIVCFAMFGSKAWSYWIEIFDVSQQISGFVPAGTLIAISARKDQG